MAPASRPSLWKELLRLEVNLGLAIVPNRKPPASCPSDGRDGVQGGQSRERAAKRGGALASARPGRAIERAAP
jgi:hypothetical protein